MAHGGTDLKTTPCDRLVPPCATAFAPGGTAGGTVVFIGRTGLVPPCATCATSKRQCLRESVPEKGNRRSGALLCHLWPVRSTGSSTCATASAAPRTRPTGRRGAVWNATGTRARDWHHRGSRTCGTLSGMPRWGGFARFASRRESPKVRNVRTWRSGFLRKVRRCAPQIHTRAHLQRLLTWCARLQRRAARMCGCLMLSESVEG